MNICVLTVKRTVEEVGDGPDAKKQRVEEAQIQKVKEQLAAKLDAHHETSLISDQIKYTTLIASYCVHHVSSHL